MQRLYGMQRLHGMQRLYRTTFESTSQQKRWFFDTISKLYSIVNHWHHS